MKSVSWLYIYTLYPTTLTAAAAALVKGLFIWLHHRLTVRLCHLTGSGPDSLSHWGSAWRISFSAAQDNEEDESIEPDRAEEQRWRYKKEDLQSAALKTDHKFISVVPFRHDSLTSAIVVLNMWDNAALVKEWFKICGKCAYSPSQSTVKFLAGARRLAPH